MPDMREGGWGTAACYLTVERLALQAGVESPFWDGASLLTVSYTHLDVYKRQGYVGMWLATLIGCHIDIIKPKATEKRGNDMLHTLEKGEYPKGHRYWSNATGDLSLIHILLR